MAKTILHGERGRLISIKFSKVKIKKETTTKLPPPQGTSIVLFWATQEFFPCMSRKAHYDQSGHDHISFITGLNRDSNRLNLVRIKLQ